MPQTQTETFRQAELDALAEALAWGVADKYGHTEPWTDDVDMGKHLARFLAARLPRCAVHNEAWYREQLTEPLIDLVIRAMNKDITGGQRAVEITKRTGVIAKGLEKAHAQASQEGEGGEQRFHRAEQVAGIYGWPEAQDRIAALSDALRERMEDNPPTEGNECIVCGETWGDADHNCSDSRAVAALPVSQGEGS